MLDLDTGEKRELPFLDYFGVDNGGRFYSKDTNEDIEVRFISEGEWNVIDHFIVEEVDPREASSIKILSNNGIAFRMVDRVVITDPQFSDEGKPAIKKKSDVDKWQML
jgi:hypothetical protein